MTGTSAHGRVGLVSSLESESVFIPKESCSAWERKYSHDCVTAITAQVTILSLFQIFKITFLLYDVCNGR